MGVIFFLTFLIVAMFSISLLLLISGVILALIYVRSCKKGKPIKILPTIATASYIMSGIFFAIPVLILLAILAYNLIISSRVPDSFVQTEQVIELDSYDPGVSFTVDGVEYRALPLDVGMACFDMGEPIFSYMPDGIFHREEYTNYYRISHEEGFEMIYGGVNLTLYASDEYYDTIVNYYNSVDNLTWYTYDNGEEVSISEENDAFLMEVESHAKVWEVSEHEEYPVDEEPSCYSFYAYSDDSLVEYTAFDLVVLEGRVYHGSVYYEDDGMVCYLIEFPEELSEEMLALIAVLF